MPEKNSQVPGRLWLWRLSSWLFLVAAFLFPFVAGASYSDPWYSYAVGDLYLWSIPVLLAALLARRAYAPERKHRPLRCASGN
jgi:hypothetical protein